MSLFQIYSDELNDLYSIRLYSEFQPLRVSITDDNGNSTFMSPFTTIQAPTQELALEVWEQGITVANFIEFKSYNENSAYIRPLDSVLIGFGGQLVDSSNWISKEDRTQKTNGVSHSPTEVWIFPDNSILEITSSTVRVMKE